MAYVFDLTPAISAMPRELLITKQPNKTSYKAGEVFDPAGMEVSVTYTNGVVKQVTNYTYSPTTPLDSETRDIVITYTEKGKTLTATLHISVESTLESIAVTKQPTKTVYNYGEKFDSAGMEVTATYSNGSQMLVSGWTVNTTTLNTLGTVTITVTYTEVDITRTATLTVTVNQVKLVLPTQKGSLTYTGKQQEPQWNNYDVAQLTIGGNTYGTNANSYTANFTPKYGYVWNDNSSVSKDVVWVIDKASITVVPSQKNALTYTGKQQEPQWNNYNTEQLTISGATSGINADTYTATFTPTSNYKWYDNAASKSVTWTIAKAIISVAPTQSGTLTYTGNSQTPKWNNFDTNQLTLSGVTTGTTAGTYTAKFTPKANYTWSDGSTTAKDVNWIIGKAIPILTLTTRTSTTPITSLTLKSFSTNEEYCLRLNGGNIAEVSAKGVPSVNNQYQEVLTARVGNTSTNIYSLVYFTPVSNGTAELIFQSRESTNYGVAILIVTVNVSALSVGEITDSWATISARTTAGQAANYYAVGSWKNVQFSGNYGRDETTYKYLSETAINQTMRAFIIGIDHNTNYMWPYVYDASKQDASSKKGFITWQLGKINNIQTAIYDKNNYDQNITSTASNTSYKSPFIIEVQSPNSSDATETIFNRTVVGQFLDEGTSVFSNTFYYFKWLLPNDLLSVLVTMEIPYYNCSTKLMGVMYSAVTLPSVVELAGSSGRSGWPYSNDDQDKQYEYYANGNSRYFYKYNSTSNYCNYWTRSTSSSSGNFSYIAEDPNGAQGQSGLYDFYPNRAQNRSCGITPIFFT